MPTFACRAHLDKASSVALVVTDAEWLGRHGDSGSARQHRGRLTARWDGYDGLRPVAPGTYQIWLRATDVVGNLSPRTLVGDVAGGARHGSRRWCACSASRSARAETSVSLAG